MFHDREIMPHHARVTSAYLFLACLTLHLNLLPVGGTSSTGTQACTFPGYLLAQYRWETNISLERRVIGSFWEFTSQTAVTTDLLSTSSNKTVNYTCADQLEDDKYIVSTFTNTHQPSYRCLQFLPRSPNIVQLQTSTSSAVYSTELCSNANLTLNIHPLVSPQLIGPPGQSPSYLVGGFEFTLSVQSLNVSVSTGADNVTLCSTSDILPLWEADCSGGGGGINIDFRMHTCRSNLFIDSTQQLFSLGSWTQGANSFAILTDMSEFWPHLWMIRFPAVASNTFDVDIYTSIVTIETPTVALLHTYYTMHMRRAPFTSLCQDEAQTCRACGDGASDRQCLKTCNDCTNSSVDQSCSFSDEARGNWLQVSYTGTDTINVTSTGSLLYGTDSPRTCIPINTIAYFQGQDIWTVSALSSNGCRPRYSCVRFSPQGPSVLQMSLSSVSVWPQPLPLDPTQICAAAMFTDPPPTTTETELHPSRWRALVRDSGSTPIPTVSCSLTRVFQLQAYTSSGVNCTATIDACKDDPTSFDYIPSPLCSGSSSISPWTQSCIASYTDQTTGDQVLVTRPSAVPDRTMLTEGGADAGYLCWMFHKNAWDPLHRLFLTRASDCHSEVANDIVYRGFTGYLAQFVVVSGPAGSFGTNCSSASLNAKDGVSATPPSIRPGAFSIVTVVITLLCVSTH